jgi:peptidoglycan/LPS O-acetylase OafA/YrhL
MRSPALDGLRGFACLLVLLFHYVSSPIWRPAPGSALSWIKAIASMGWCGVDIFFVLSGFLLGGRCLERVSTPNYFRDFYLRRMLRILPLYFFFLLVGHLSLSLVFHEEKFHWINRPSPVWPFLIQLQNIQMALQQKLGPYWLSGTWSLAVEEHFYLLLPWLIYWSRSSRFFVHLLLSLIASSILFRGVLWLLIEDDGLPNYILTPSRWDALFIGVLGAWLFKRPSFTLWLRSNPKKLWLLSALLPVMLSIFLMPGVESIEESLRVFMYTLIALCALALLFLSLVSEGAMRFFSWAPLRFVGELSYPLYLIHPLVFGLVSTTLLGRKPFFTSPSQLWVSGVCFVIVLGLSWILHRLIERPLLAAR